MGGVSGGLGLNDGAPFMELIDDYGERRRIMTAGSGVLLVDRAGAGTKPSILHGAYCTWLSKVSRSTPVRFAPSREQAVNWLDRDRAHCGRWRICPECSGLERRSAPLRPQEAAAQEVAPGLVAPSETPSRSPLATLLERGVVDVRRYAARIDFIRQYERMAAPTQGLAGVLAASVELHPHQLRVVQRVLDDPFQRYLLADEVGLGKTIEAGLIIRQRLLDAPRSLVVVFCPGSLAWQWEEELEDRLGLSDLRPNGIEVVAYDENPRAFDRLLTPDLIVFDEAHRIAGGWDSSEREQGVLFKKAAELTGSTPRVLLLSATPVLQNERTFLAMLHLLDPDTFKLSEAAADRFEQRMRGREQIGGIFARLNDALPAFLRRGALQELADEFADDDELAALVRDAVADVEREREAEGHARTPSVEHAQASLAAVRTHVSETYRVHRRMLRTRRKSASETTYRVRGRQGLLLIPDPDPRRGTAEAWLTRWRSVVAEESEGDPNRESTAVAAVAMFVERASGDLNAMAALAKAALVPRRDQMVAAGVSPAERAVLRALWPSDPLRQLLTRLADALVEDDVDRASGSWIAAVVEELERRDGKSVAFAPATPSAVQLAASIRRHWGDGSVELFLADQTIGERRDAVRRLRRDPECRMLVCDRSGEEGLNLQEAAMVVHLGLPLIAGRVEQRIGRLDRRNDGEAVISIAPAPIPGGFVDAWCAALRDGFKVFDRSSAPIQYAVENVERAFLRAVALNGPSTAVGLVAGLSESVELEQAKIDRVEGLDALAGEPTRESEMISTFERVETEADRLSDAMKRLLERSADTLGLEKHPSPTTGGVAYGVDASSPLTRLYAGIELQGVQLVNSRELALTDPEVRLALPGSPGVDLLRRLVAGDTASWTFAHWATESAEVGATVAFCCDVLVRADVGEAFSAWVDHERKQPTLPRAHRSAADAPLDRAAFQRIVDAHLEPQVVRVWISTSGESIDSPALLEQAMHDTQPQQWTSAAWDRAEIIGNVRSFESIADRVLESANASAVAVARKAADPVVAGKRFREEIRRDLVQRRLRATRDGSSVAKGELAAMAAVLPALVRAVDEPSAELIGIGLLVVSNEPLPAVVS